MSLDDATMIDVTIWDPDSARALERSCEAYLAAYASVIVEAADG